MLLHCLNPVHYRCSGFLATGAQIYVLVCSRWGFLPLLLVLEGTLTHRSASLREPAGEKLHHRRFFFSGCCRFRSRPPRPHLLCVELLGGKKKTLLQMFTAERWGGDSRDRGMRRRGEAMEKKERKKEKKQSRYVNSGGCGTRRRPP